MPPIPPPREEGYTRTTTAPLYWVRYGQHGGKPLLLLHGGPGADHRYLLPQMLHWTADHDMILYDQRGGGQSKTGTQDPVTWRTHVSDLEALIGELLVAPLTIVGYSWGGLLALLYAVEAAAGRVAMMPDRLVLIDPAPVTRQYRAEFEERFAVRQASPVVRGLREELVASGLRQDNPEAYRQRAFELSVAGYFADPRLAHELTPFRVVARVQQSVWESLGEFDLLAPGQLDSVHLPAIVIHGRQDPIPLASSEGVAGALGASLIVLDRCGHVPYVEQPDALFSAIDHFLASSSG